MLRAEFLITGFVELLLNAHEVVLEARALVLQEPVLILDLVSKLLLTLTLFRNDLELLLHGVPLQAPVFELGLGLFELRLLPLNLSHRVVDLGLCLGNGALPFLLPYGHPLVLEIFLVALKLRFERQCDPDGRPSARAAMRAMITSRLAGLVEDSILGAARSDRRRRAPPGSTCRRPEG